MQLFYQPGIPDGAHHLDAVESRHAVRVLRLQEGNLLSITDGQGRFYEAQILRAESSKCTFQILKTITQPLKKYQVHIAIAPTKNADRTEWFAEKAVELGIDQISFVLCKNSERKSVNLDRMEKIAISAMKQSQHARLPAIVGMVPFKSILATPNVQKLIAAVDPQNPRHLKSAAIPEGNYLVLIGPEGDFTNEEIQLALGYGFQKVSLGSNRLRTETAGVIACHILNLINSA